METIKVLDKTFVPYIRHADLLSSIDALCKKLDEDYADCGGTPVLLCTLHGAIPFTAEVMQRINFETHLAAIQLSTYNGTQSSGSIQSITGPTANLEGKKVIVLEDIVDTGFTLIEMRRILKEKGAAEVKFCTLLYKQEKFEQQMKEHNLDIAQNEPEYCGIIIPDNFVLGFGLDYNQYGRNHKDLYILEQ